MIDGRAACILPASLKSVANNINVGGLVNIFEHISSEEEGVIVDCSINFELSLILCRKQQKSLWLKEMIISRIEDKRHIFSHPFNSSGICLIGHSQFDQWNIADLCGYQICNCRISGITAREYIDYIIDRNILKFSERIIIVLIGINDIALPQTVATISRNIIELLDKVQKKVEGQIFYIQTLHVNGRLDRDNRKVNELNKTVKNSLLDDICWISTDAMDDDFGNLDYKFTIDGLHLSDVGYKKLEEIIKSSIR